MEDGICLESRLDVRWLRDFFADPSGRCGAPRFARADAIRPDTGVCWHGYRHHAPGMGYRWSDRRSAGRLYWPPPHHDLCYSRLLDNHRVVRFRLGLGIVCAVALPGRHCHRLGMVDRRLSDCGSMAGRRARPWGRAYAMRPWHWFLPRLVRLAVRQQLWPGRVAHHVLHWCDPGVVRSLAAYRRSRVRKNGRTATKNENPPRRERKAVPRFRPKTMRSHASPSRICSPIRKSGSARSSSS